MTAAVGAAQREEPYFNSASVRVTAGALAGPVVCRVVSILAARADCPVDRLDDALLICDAIAAHAPKHAPDAKLDLTVEARHGGLKLRLGPLEPDGADALIADTAVPGIGNVLERVADDLRVERTDGAGELLVIALGF